MVEEEYIGCILDLFSQFKTDLGYDPTTIVFHPEDYPLIEQYTLKGSLLGMEVKILDKQEKGKFSIYNKHIDTVEE